MQRSPRLHRRDEDDENDDDGPSGRVDDAAAAKAGVPRLQRAHARCRTVEVRFDGPLADGHGRLGRVRDQGSRACFLLLLLLSLSAVS